GRGPDVVGWLARLLPARRTPGGGGYVVAVYEPDAPVGAAPLLLVRAGSADPPVARGRGLATALGHVEPAGALVIEARGWEVVPGRAAPPGARGRGLATGLGHVGPAGALVIEARGWEVVPVEPPEAPGEGAPPWTETGAPGPS